MPAVFLFFFFNDTATTEIYTLSLHDALPICWPRRRRARCCRWRACRAAIACCASPWATRSRSEEHTSELQSQSNLVCRLLLEKKKKNTNTVHIPIPHDLHTLNSTHISTTDLN